MNLARLNHILIPETFAERERLRRSRLGRPLRPLWFLYTHLTPRGRALAVLTLVVGGFGLQVETTQVYVVFALLAGMLVAALARTGAFALRDVEIAVDCPRRVAVGEPQRFSVALANRGRAPCRAVMVEGPFLPWDGRWEGEARLADEIAPGATATVTATARFSRRGEHHLDPFTAAALLPIGLSTGARIASAPARFVVVPPIAPVARLSLPMARRHQPGGVAQAARTGDSADLLGVRDYRPGDPIRDLHARSWARTGVPIVREYQEEYFSRVGVVVDTDLGRGDARRLEAGLSLAAGVVANLSHGEALIDLLVVGDQVSSLTLGRSLGFMDQALDLLACVEPGRRFDAAAMARGLAPFLGRLSAIVFVALAWDDARAAFADAVVARGVPCRTLLVDGPGAPARPAAGPALAVPVEAIERKEPLAL